MVDRYYYLATVTTPSGDTYALPLMGNRLSNLSPELTGGNTAHIRRVDCTDDEFNAIFN